MNPFMVRLAVVGLFVASAASAAVEWDAIESVPGRTPVVVRVSGHERNYFRVTPHEPLTITIEGPAKVRVVSRAEFREGARGVQSYRLRAFEGPRQLDELATESSASEQAAVRDGEAAGKSRKFSFAVPAGRHAVTLSLEGAAAVLVRVRTAARRPQAGMVSLTPIEAGRSLLLAEGEKTIPYYEITPAAPVRLRVIGPVQLDLGTRLCFDATQRGAQSYRMAVRENGRVLREIAVTTTKATTATFANARDRVPSKLDRTTLSLGPGTHELWLSLIEPARGAIAVHARIPAPTIGNEE